MTDCDSEEQREIRRQRSLPQQNYFGTHPLVTKIYRLKWISETAAPADRERRLEEAATAVRTVLTPRGRLEVDRDTDTLVIVDLASILAVVEEGLLRRLESYREVTACEGR